MGRVWVLVGALLAPGLSAAQTAAERLDRLAAESLERWLDLFPVSEVFSRGAGPRQDRYELIYADEHRARQRAYQHWVLQELAKIPAAELNSSEKITHALLAWRARDALDSLAYPLHQHSAFVQIGGGVAFGLVRVIERQPFTSEADYQAWFRRVKRYPGFFDDTERLAREGMAAGVTAPRVLVQRMLSQLDALAPEDMATSSLWKPMTQFPASIGAETRSRLEAEYRRLLAEEMFPALRRLATFVRNEYVPKARTTDGLGALPNGAAMYRYYVRAYTTTELTPDEVHELGLKEVPRVRELYLAAAAKVGYSGGIRGIREWLNGKPENHPFTSAEQVIAYLDALHARIVPQMPKLFGRLPKARFEIRLTDPTIAASSFAQYYSPTDDGRPGIFAMPVTNPRQISTFYLPALLAHEGIPGHHLDVGIKLENPVPEFRRRLSFGAFGEGWAVYAESLGHQLGLYDEPFALVGRYWRELLFAGLLVMDTGLHSRGWTRQQAARYLVEECGMTQAGANAEVLQRMAVPGQALSYKIGELKVRELRARAERALGPRFDLRAFHDAILEEGHVPLTMLEVRMQAWIASQERRLKL